MRDLEDVRNTVLKAGATAIPALKAKNAEQLAPHLAELRRVIRRAKSTSGVVLGAREMELAITRLDECQMWAGAKGWVRAAARLDECLMWACEGISAEKATQIR